MRDHALVVEDSWWRPRPALGFVKQMVRHAFYPDLEEHLLVGEAVQPKLASAAEAHRVSEGRHLQGKLVFEVR